MELCCDRSVTVTYTCLVCSDLLFGQISGKEVVNDKGIDDIRKVGLRNMKGLINLGTFLLIQ
jgi:hypothetical protein